MQKGFTPLILLVGILVLAVVAGGAYFFGKLPIKPSNIQPKACTQEAKQCSDGSFVGRAGSNCEFNPCPSVAPKTPDASPAPSGAGEITDWKTYTNTQYGYSVKYSPHLDQTIFQDNDTYLSLISFTSSDENIDGFSIEVHNSTLEEEIKYQKWTIDGHVLASLTRETQINVGGFSGALLEYTPDQSDSGSVARFVIVNNGKYSYTIKGKPQTLDKILSTFKFTN